tara:strand:+ start:45226 stop:45600 length:375 start_codon:yes stop_codon:yes gene_type:complete
VYKKNKDSYGERMISKILKNLNISYIKEHEFKDCINPNTNQKLKFDFFLPKKNICIEYDGIQHFEYIKDFYGNDQDKGQQKFDNQIMKDEYKSEYCLNNNIRLLRISYNEIDKIRELIIQFINE